MNDRKYKAIELQYDADKLYKKELYDEAIKLYTLSIESDPLLINAYLGITKCYIRTNSIHTASDFLEKTIKVADSGRVANIKKGIAGVFFNTNNPEEAFSVFESIYQKTNNVEEQKLGLKYLIASNEIEKAIEDINTRFNNQPNILNELLLGDYLTSEQKNKLANQQGDIVGSIKKQMLSLINAVNEQLVFISEKTSDSLLISNWNNALQSFNEAEDISEMLMLKEELETLKKKVEIEYQVYSTSFQKGQIDELFADKGISRETLASLTKEFVFMATLLDKNQDGDLKQKSTAFYDDYNSQFKTPLDNNDFGAVARNFEYATTLIEQHEAVKTKLFANVKTFVESKKELEAERLIQQLQTKFPDDKRLLTYKKKIEEKKAAKRKQQYIWGTSVVASLLFVLIYVFGIRPHQQEKSIWEKALSSGNFDAYIDKYPDGVHSEEAYIGRIKTQQLTFISTVQGLRLREQPNEGSKVILTILENEEMTYLKEQSKHKSKISLRGVVHNEPWYKVSFRKDGDTHTGWVFGGGVDNHQDFRSSCKQYLKKFPNGSFVEKAEKFIRILNRRKEEADWKAALAQNTVGGYLEFLQNYPNAEDYTTAKQKILALNTTEEVVLELIKHRDCELAEMENIITHDYDGDGDLDVLAFYMCYSEGTSFYGGLALLRNGVHELEWVNSYSSGGRCGLVLSSEIGQIVIIEDCYYQSFDPGCCPSGRKTVYLDLEDNLSQME